MNNTMSTNMVEMNIKIAMMRKDLNDTNAQIKTKIDGMIADQTQMRAEISKMKEEDSQRTEAILMINERLEAAEVRMADSSYEGTFMGKMVGRKGEQQI